MKTLERQLAEYFEYQSDLHGPISTEEVTSPSPPLVAPSRSRATRPVWIVSTAAAAVLVLIGGVAWLAWSLGNESAPVITQIPVPTSTVSTVVEQASGVIETPIGPATWVRLTGDVSPLPGSGQAISWPSGFAIFERPFNSSPPPAPVSRSAQLWVSDDGIEWRVEPLPLDPAAQDVSLTLVEGVYWLLSWDPRGLWRSTDGANWDEVDSSGLLPPGPIGLSWTMSYMPPVTAGALTLSHARFEADLPFRDWLPLLIADYDASVGDETCGRLRRLEPGVFQIVGGFGDPPCPYQLALRFEETETGLRVLDNATGEEFGEVVGADLSHIERLAQDRDAYIEERLLIIGDSEITPVDAPWPASLPTSGQRLQALFGAQDSIYAYVGDDSEQVSVWRTSDGRSWTDLGPPSFLKDTPATINLRFTSLADSLAVTIFDTSDSPEVPIAWETADGVNWSPGPPTGGLPDGMNLLRRESGWFANDGSMGGLFDGDVWWMHAGGSWVSLAELGIEGRCAGAVTTSADDITFFFGCGPRGSPDLWILTLAPSR